MVRFVRDFRSQYTGENFFASGQTAEFAADAERALIAEGAAVLVPIQAREGQVDPTAAKEPEPAPPESPEPRVLRGRKGAA